jgi:hypothetical protein
MANMPPSEGQLRLKTDTCWIAGNTPVDPGTGNFAILPQPRSNINISQMLNEWAIMTSHHVANNTPLLFEQSSVDACPNAVAAIQARALANDGINNSYWPQSVLNPAAGVVMPITGGTVFLDVATPFSQFLKNQPFIIPPGALDFNLYSVTLQNKMIEIVNRVPPPPPVPPAFQQQQAQDIIQLMVQSSLTDMHQLIGESFYFLKQVRDILGPTGWPKLAVEITGGKSRNYTRRKKRASAKRYK